MNSARAAIGSLADGQRLVVKIGSALLVDEASGTLRRSWLEALAADVAELRAAGQEVLIVSSGAIAVGRRHLRFPPGVLRLDEKQAAAATGMIRLAHAYQEVLARHGLTVAQVLLTLSDTEDRRRYLNARNTLTTLLRVGAVPLINENDTVATDEIRFGDNDRLAARVADMVSADTLALLSDIDGFYSADPRKNADARLIPVIRDISAELERAAGNAASGYGSGGMITKLAAAKIAVAAGCRMVIADGKPMHPLRRIDEGTPCTWFLPTATPQTSRKRWIGATLRPMGALVVDAGAARALQAGKSLLPVGVVAVEGEFSKGDAVVIRISAGRELGRGLCAYAAADARRIAGHKAAEIGDILGYRGPDEMIHRDNLVIGTTNGDEASQ
jgi:glutamate 5-kinase